MFFPPRIWALIPARSMEQKRKAWTRVLVRNMVSFRLFYLKGKRLNEVSNERYGRTELCQSAVDFVEGDDSNGISLQLGRIRLYLRV
jgi:hypothetical protein